MKFALLTCLILTCFNSYAQKYSNRPEIKKIVHQIQRRNVYEISYSDRYTPKQIAYADKLGKLATDSELVALTNHRNGVVRVYAFEKLEERNYAGLYLIILNHIQDDETIRWYNHGGEWIHGGKGKTKVDELFVSCRKLKTNEREQLDSILIYSDRTFSYVNSLFIYHQLNEKYYSRIKEFAAKDVYSGATNALAKFQQPEDTTIIANNIRKSPYYKMEVIEIFPHPYFKEILNEYRNTKSKPFWLYKPIAAYRDSYAHDYLLECLNDSASNDYFQKEKAKQIFEAIEKYRCPAFNDLLFQLWRTDFLISDSMLQYLISVDPKQTLELTIRSLEHADKFHNNSLIIDALLDFLVVSDTLTAKRIINENIIKAYVLELSYYAEHAKSFKDSQIISSLFDRLSKSDNAYVYMPIVETILFYNDTKLNEKLLTTIKSNELINDWGREKVVQMLAAHNLHL